MGEFLRTDLDDNAQSEKHIHVRTIQLKNIPITIWPLKMEICFLYEVERDSGLIQVVKLLIYLQWV